MPTEPPREPTEAVVPAPEVAALIEELREYHGEDGERAAAALLAAHQRIGELTKQRDLWELDARTAQANWHAACDELATASDDALEHALEAAKKAGFGMTSVLHPPGQPGSYWRGEHAGIVAATQTIIAAIRALKGKA